MNREELLEDMQGRMVAGFLPRIYCEDGWIPLISGLYETLLEISPNFVIAQIKEKFGGLRFYAYPNTEDDEVAQRFRSAIRDAENASFTICELTGKSGAILMKSNHGWIRTLDEETGLAEGYTKVERKQI